MINIIGVLTVITLCIVAFYCLYIRNDKDKVIPSVFICHNVQCGDECVAIYDVANPSNQTRDCTFILYSCSNTIIMRDTIFFDKTMNYKMLKYQYKITDSANIKPAYAELHVKDGVVQTLPIVTNN